MKTFEYVRPATVSDAVAAAAEPGAAYLAAGTNLLDLMKGGITPSEPSRRRHASAGARPHRTSARWRHPHRRAGSQRRSRARSGFRASPIRRSPRRCCPGASAQLRNAATVGGNLLQRTRCGYFYDTASACNKREPGAGCDAAAAKTACTPCSAGARPASPPIRRISACRWWRSTRSWRSRAEPAGARSRWRHLHRLPGDTPERESVLEPGDLIVALRLPGEARDFAAHARYLKVRERTSYAFAVVSAAARLRIEARQDRRCAARARRRRRQTLARPRGREDPGRRTRPDATVFRRAAEAALADAKPSGDNAFKIELAQRILVRALTLAAAGTPARIPALPASPFSSVIRSVA